ncbi:hypothetical protein AB3R30_15195 [Leptolyngbyaceae cyanobacterium UHCC 1019]
MQIFNGNKKPFIDSSDLIPLFVLGTLGLQLLNLLINSGGAVSLWSMVRKPAPAMVQLLDGRSVAMEAVDTEQRTPMVIRQFIKSSLGLMFTWNARIPVNKDMAVASTGTSDTVKDPGVSIGTGGRITTASWQAAFALKEDFRNPFLEQVARMTPSEVFSGGAQSVLSFESVSVPKPVKVGQWQVDIVASLLIFDSTHPQGLAVPFNKSIFVTAIEPTTDPLADNSSPIQKAVYRIQESGLQIREIRDLDIQQLNQ